MTAALNETILAFRLPAYSEIPDVGLFLEQTAKFVNSYLEPLGSVSLTTSMISNYVKKKLLSNPVKKQYNREQIAHILFVAVAKTVLSLEDIQTLLQLYPEHYDCQRAYEYFCQEFVQILRYVFRLEGEPSEVRAEEPEEKQLLRSTMMAAAYKIYLDECFQQRKRAAEQE